MDNIFTSDNTDYVNEKSPQQSGGIFYFRCQINRIYANKAAKTAPGGRQKADTTTPIDSLLAASTALEQHTDNTNSIEQLIMRTRIEIQPEEIRFTGFF